MRTLALVSIVWAAAIAWCAPVRAEPPDSSSDSASNPDPDPDPEPDVRPRGNDGLDRTAWHLRSDTRFVAYDIQASGGRVVWQRRRLYQRVGFDFVVRLGDLERAERQGYAEYTLHLRVDLRLDQDFGQVCDPAEDECLDEFRERDRLDYQVLARGGRLDVPSAQVELRGPSFHVRLGRQLVADGIGLVRLDGLSTRYEPHPWAAVSVYGGVQVREDWLGGNAGLTLTGPLRFELPDEVLPERAPYVTPPTFYGVAGTQLELGKLDVLRATLGYREVRDGPSLAARRFALGATSTPHAWVRLQAELVLDGVDGTPLDAFGMARVAPDPGEWDLHLRASHTRPRFDLGTIWAYFQTVPVTRFELGAGWRPAERWSTRAALRMRTSDPEPSESAERDYGGELSFRYDSPHGQIGARAFVYLGDLDPVAALLAHIRGRLGRFVLYGRGALWYHDLGDVGNMSSRRGISGGGALGVSLDMGDISTLRAEAELTSSPGAGLRWRTLAFLDLEVMR